MMFVYQTTGEQHREVVSSMSKERYYRYQLSLNGDTDEKAERVSIEISIVGADHDLADKIVAEVDKAAGQIEALMK